MATREQKIVRAKELIAAYPQAGRREIARKLRQQYDEGLRDSVILSLQREVYPERRRVIVDPYQLAKSTERYRPLRQGRYNKLVKMNFSSEEARKLSTLPLTRLPFIKNMAKSRKDSVATLIHQAGQLGWSKTKTKDELKDYIDYIYKDSGWADFEGNNNPYSMVRHFRREAINAGLWDPKDSPWRKKKSIREKMNSPKWKGDTAGQKSRWRKLHKETIAESKATYKQKQRQKKLFPGVKI